VIVYQKKQKMSKKNKIRKIINIITGAEKRHFKVWVLIDGIPQQTDFKKDLQPHDIIVRFESHIYKPKNQNNE